MKAQTRGGASTIGLVVFACGAFWLSEQFGGLRADGGLHPLSLALLALAGLAALKLVMRILTHAAFLLDWVSARTATGKDGTAKWAKLKDYSAELLKGGPFWGLSLDGRNTPLLFGFASNAMTIGPAGSGKGIYTVVNMILAIRWGKLIPDFKGELVCMLKTALERLGETVRVLNPGGLFSDIIGQTDSYNPLDIIVDDLCRPGGLRDVPDDLREMSCQILQEPGEKESDNTYFREGGRQFIGQGKLIETMVEGRGATLSSVALLLEDRERFEDNLRWIAGVDLDGNPHADGPFPIEHTEWAQLHDPQDVAEFAKLVRARAKGALSLMNALDSKTFDSFITGARQALAPFAFGRLAPAMGRSTFRFADMKEGEKPTSVFIVADASRAEAYKPFMGLVQWCALTELKRHPDKERPVHCIFDEATNYVINGLESLLTWGRSYGLRLHLIFQNFPSFQRVYGKQALATLLSETEIKQFLPGQREPETLAMMRKMLGDQSVMNASVNFDAHGSARESLSESGRPQMTEDEIRRANFGLLFVRKCQALAFEPISWAEIDPWRDQVGINPFHGKPYRKKVRLKL